MCYLNASPFNTNYVSCIWGIDHSMLCNELNVTWCLVHCLACLSSWLTEIQKLCSTSTLKIESELKCEMWYYCKLRCWRGRFFFLWNYDLYTIITVLALMWEQRSTRHFFLTVYQCCSSSGWNTFLNLASSRFKFLWGILNCSLG